MKLYELSEQYQKLMSMMDNPDFEADMLKDTLEGLTGEIEEKVDNITKILKGYEADEAALKAEEQRLNDRRKTVEKRRDGLKKYLENELIKMDIKNVKTNLFTVYIQKNKASVHIDETKMDSLKKIKDIWTIPEPVLNKTKLYELVKDGKEIDGVSLVSSESIRIK